MDIKLLAEEIWKDGETCERRREKYWVGLERALRAIFQLHISDSEKLILINEAIGAFTGRGQAVKSTLFS